MPIEEYFAVIDGFPNYIVSNYGRVINTKFDRDIQPIQDKRDGTQKIRLYNQGKYSDLLLHRVVAQAFFANYSDEREVILISGNKSDCSVTNITIGMDVRGNKRND